jgi:gluconokinase
VIVILMGVSGVGKTTVGELLARETGWPLYDADDFHSAPNIEKMRIGIALTDEDRWPWLDRLNATLREIDQRGGSALLACSALKQRYRDVLKAGRPGVRFVYLCGSEDLIRDRLKRRRGHYMPASLLASQFAALEEPGGAITVDIGRPPDEIVTSILAGLGVR